MHLGFLTYDSLTAPQASTHHSGVNHSPHAHHFPGVPLTVLDPSVHLGLLTYDSLSVLGVNHSLYVPQSPSGLHSPFWGAPRAPLL